MATEISLRRTFELADVAIMDIKRLVGTPSQIYLEAREFSFDFMRVASVNGWPSGLVSRAIPAGVDKTQKRMKDAIISYKLSNDMESKLLDLIDSMAEMALQDKPEYHKVDKFDPEIYAPFLAKATEFLGLLSSLQGTYITTTQVNHLVGLIIFGVPAWLCWSYPAWVVQILIFLAWLFWRSGEEVDDAVVRRRIKNIEEWIAGKTSITPDELKEKIKEEAKGLDDEQKEEYKKQMEKIRDNPFLDSDLSEAIDEAINEI